MPVEAGAVLKTGRDFCRYLLREKGIQHVMHHICHREVGHSGAHQCWCGRWYGGETSGDGR